MNSVNIYSNSLKSHHSHSLIVFLSIYFRPTEIHYIRKDSSIWLHSFRWSNAMITRVWFYWFNGLSCRFGSYPYCYLCILPVVLLSFRKILIEVIYTGYSWLILTVYWYLTGSAFKIKISYHIFNIINLFLLYSPPLNCCTGKYMPYKILSEWQEAASFSSNIFMLFRGIVPDAKFGD